MKSEDWKSKSVFSKIIDGKIISWDHPNVIYMASDLVNEYGEIMEKNSKFVFGASEKLLPYPKRDIEEAIILLLNFLKSHSSWDNLKKRYPATAVSIISNDYYMALRKGYIDLAKYIPNDYEAKLCQDLALQLMSGNFNKENIQSSLVSEAMEIHKRILEDMNQRLVYLQEKYGKEEDLFQ